PAWDIVTPMVTTDGKLVLIDRGLAPDDGKPLFRPQGEVEVTGIIRGHDGKRGYFDLDNDPGSNMWSWWDVPAMLADTPVALGVERVPFVLHLIPRVEQPGFPRPSAPAAVVSNNHLQYAITWFSLAGVLAVIAGLFIRGEMRKSGA
ncbi:MAG TPA: SURF1 family protein, partial [Aestuariivirga sp.]|nr:SURF1 family protein [Aestuariivirga sp.]